ncbi:hypothetical protein BW28_05840 [Clostridioides difficile]|nr:hypothetical protein BW28_05840 [Clostridioides difficile]
MRGIAIAFFEVDVDAVTPRIFLHDADKFREEHILRSVRVVPQGFEDAVRSVIRYGQKPLDMRIAVDVGEHIGNRHAALVNLPSSPDLEGEKSDLADAVAVVTQSVIHSGVAHERPHHDFLSL